MGHNSMMKRRAWRLCWLVLCLAAMGSARAGAADTAFLYQGLLTQSAVPAQGACDLRFELYDQALEGQCVAGPLTEAVVAEGGAFSVSLDFGSGVFDGGARWMEISARTGSNAFTVLRPRQRIASAPYAIRAAEAGRVDATAVRGMIAESQIPLNFARLDAGAAFAGGVTAKSFSGDGSGLTGVPPSTDTNAVTGLVALALAQGNTIYVDPVAGSDATGQRGTSRAFATLAAALSNVVNDTVVVLRPGQHRVQCVDLCGEGSGANEAAAFLRAVTNVTLLGSGATVIASNYGYAMTISDCRSISIRDIRWVGDYGSWVGAKGIAGCLGMGGTNYGVEVSGCAFEEWPDQVITSLCGHARNTIGLTVVNNRFKNVGMTNAPWLFGLPDGACVSGTIAGNCVVQGNRTEGRIVRFFEYENVGTYWEGGCTNILVANNVIAGLWDWGILFGGPLRRAYNVRISDNLLEYPEGHYGPGLGAIFVSDVRGGVISGNQVWNYQSWVYGSERAAISVQRSDWVVVENNLLKNCSPVAISAGAGPFGGSDHTMVRNNTIIGGVDWGIVVGSTNAWIIGNLIEGIANPNGVAIGIGTADETGTLAVGGAANVLLRNNILRGQVASDTVFVFAAGAMAIPRFVLDNNDNETEARDLWCWTPEQTVSYRNYPGPAPLAAAAVPAAAQASLAALGAVAAPRSSGDCTVVFGAASESITPEGAVRFSGSTNRVAGAQTAVCLLPSTAVRSLSFHPDWILLDGPAPAEVPAGKAAVVTFRCFGESESRVVVKLEIQK